MIRLITIILVTSTFILKAQDVHFTMYDAVPININPATAGVFNGDVRGVLNYRNQWSSIGSPFKTYSVMLDGGLFKNEWKNGFLGLGFNAFRDVAGSSNYGTTEISLALSGVVYLTRYSSASIGLKGGWAQNSINLNNLNWDSQFNGSTFDQSINSDELFTSESISYFDFSVGGLWAYGRGSKTLSSHDEFNTKIGFSYSHVGKPNLQLVNGDQDRLYSKLSIHGDAYIGVPNSRLAFAPRMLLFFQGPSREIMGGLLLRYLVREESKYTGLLKGIAFSLGSYYRAGDAISPSLELEIANYAIGFSYDINVSRLNVATNGAGGAEVFIRFINPNPFSYGKGTRSNPRFQ